MNTRDKYIKMAIFLVLMLFLAYLVMADSVIINPTGCTDSDGDCTLSNVQTQNGISEETAAHRNALKRITTDHDDSSAINNPDSIDNVSIFMDRYESTTSAGATLEITVTRPSDGTSTSCTLTSKTTGDNNYDVCDVTSFVTTESNAEALDVAYEVQALGNGESFFLDHVYVNITYSDTTAPSILLNSPGNNNWTNSTNVSFYFTPNDVASGILNCSLMIDSKLNQSNRTVITEGIQNVIWTNLTEGIHNWTVNCTDSSDNLNVGTNGSVRIIKVDITAPYNITLNLPNNFSNISCRNLIFNFTAYDAMDKTLNCSIYINGTLNQTNNSVSNATLTNFWIDNFLEGRYKWNVSCRDSAGNVNWSNKTRMVNVDTAAPAIRNITFTPNSTDDIDPGVSLNVTVNISDFTDVSQVVFQYKQVTAGDYTNITMTYNRTSGLANASFTPNVRGIWNYRVWANDTLRNTNTTITYDLSVELDYTWDINPISVDSVGCIINSICTLANLTINNTGDYTLNFDLSHTPASITISYNDTEPFDLAAKGIRIIQVNATTPSTTGEYGIIITTDATSADADPNSATTNITLAAYTGGPYFDLSITTYPVSAEQSGSYNLIARLRNIGNETATGTWINWTLPTGWSNTSGNLTKNVGSLASGASESNNITVNLNAATASAGTQTISVKASGVGASGNTTDTSSASVVVSCSSTDGACGAGCTPLTDSNCVVAAGGGAGAGGGGGAMAKKLISRITGLEILKSEETFELTRGEQNSFPITVTNIFEKASLRNVELAVEGYLSQYLRISPAKISEIRPNETSEFIVTISSPTYMKRGTYPLEFTITGDMVGEHTEKRRDGTVITYRTEKELLETRLVTLSIFEVSGEAASLSLHEAEADFNALKEAGFPTAKVSGLLEEARKALEEKNYKRAKELSEQIGLMGENAFNTDKLISSIKEQIKASEEKGINMDETKSLLNLALAAFEREDYETALLRAKDAQLTYVLLSTGRFNILLFIRNYWWAVSLVGLTLLVSGVIAQRKLVLIMIKRKIEDLDKEETTVNELMTELQGKTFREKSISITEYHKQMYNYEKRLSEIRQLRNRLRGKRAGIIKISNEIRRLKEEDVAIIEKIKQLQNIYYNKQGITGKQYGGRREEYRLRRTEIEKSIAVLETKLAKKERLETIKSREKKPQTKKKGIELKKIFKSIPFWKTRPRKELKQMFTQDQLDEIEKKVEESQHKHPPVEDILKEMEEKANVAIQTAPAKEESPVLSQEQVDMIEEKVEKSLQNKEKIPSAYDLVTETEKAKDKKSVINVLKNTFKIEKRPKTKPKRLFKAKPMERYAAHPHDAEALERHGFKVKSGANKHGPGSGKMHDIMAKMIPKHVHHKKDIIKNLKEVYRK